MQIRVLDHIVIGNNCYYSFADEGLIEKYQTHFTTSVWLGRWISSSRKSGLKEEVDFG